MMFSIEKSVDGREYRVIEWTAAGWIVLASFSDREAAEGRMAAWKAEAVS